MPGKPETGGESGKKGTKEAEVRKKLSEVRHLLNDAVEGGCDAAWRTRGDLALFPPPPLRQNLTHAFEAYETSASLTGDPHANYLLAFFHASGYGSIVPVDHGKALLHYTFSALQGYAPAEHALAYKYWTATGVEDNCMMALGWYESVADKGESNLLLRFCATRRY
jgi:SEL1 protein